jgi:hypothetical protein
MAAQCPDLAVRAAPEARKLHRPADQPTVRYRLKRRLTVIARSPADVVLYAGGRLFDLVTGGWDGVVLTADHSDPRPLRILGARAYDLETALAGPPAGRCLDAIMVEANLYSSDARVRQMVYRARDGLTEAMLWGDDWPADLDAAAPPVRHQLSVAARAFKAHALAAAAVPADVSDIEVFRTSRIPRPESAHGL